MDGKAEIVDLKIQLIAAWFGPICIVGYSFFWGVLGHNLPPPSSGLSPNDLVTNYFAAAPNDIMLGMVGAAVFGILYIPWAVQLTILMLRKEHSSPVLAYMALLGGGITAWLLAECPATWANAASYASSNPAFTQLLWREAWYIYMLTYMITTVQMIACGVYALIDKSAAPVFPRWAGWFAIFGGLSFIPDSCVPYFTTGPVALNGWFDYYITFGYWLAWFAVYSFYMIRYVTREIRARSALQRSPPGFAGQAAE